MSNQYLKHIILILFIFTNSINVKSQEIDSTNNYIQYDNIQDNYIDTNDIDFNLIMAAESGDINKLIYYIKKGADVNATTYEGISSLMYAAQNGYYSIAEILVNNGAKLDYSPQDYPPAIISATKNNNDSIVELLILNKADINKRDYYGATPLLYACVYGYSFITEMLLYYKADISYKDLDGTDALSAATYSGYTDIVEILINKGADINTIDNNGNTPLMIAAQNGFLDIVKLFTENGVKINELNYYNENAFFIAVRNGNQDIVDYLLNKGTDVNCKNANSKTPIYFSYLTENKDMRNFLISKGSKRYFYPVINKIAIGYGINFNIHDCIFNSSIGISDVRYQSSFSLGYDTRYWRSRVWVKKNDNYYYQYREKRNILYLNLEKRIKLIHQGEKQQGLFIGAKEAFTFGTYNGSKKKIKNELLFVPQAGMYSMNRYVGAKLSYEYMNLNIENISPHRLNFSLYMFINFDKSSKHNKSINWL